ncbi:MAG: U32 family peptidase [Clostridiales bacterium]|nr:U32 family peptidase [Clostridiales bacterium]
MEICAPAGSPNALKAAVFNGADAVYLGIDKFNLRMKAENFTAENLKEYADFAHIHGVKVFLALNSCVKQSEYGEVLDVVRAAAGLADAYIVTDLSLVEKIRTLAPNAAVHVSTQAGIHNKYGAKFIEKIGAHRIILPRETDLENIKIIRDNTALEIEVFVHGALCVSFSGACLFSGIAAGKSGNRGRCLQFCRLPYYRGKGFEYGISGSAEKISGKGNDYGRGVKGGGFECGVSGNSGNDSGKGNDYGRDAGNAEKGYFLSPKDLCLIDKIDLLKANGVNAVKIEGRLKRHEYTAETVARYRAAADGKRKRGDVEELKKIYNRGGFSDGYLFGNDVISHKTANNIGLETGIVLKKCAPQKMNAEYAEYTVGKGFLEYSNNQNGSRGLKTGAEYGDKKCFLEYSNNQNGPKGLKTGAEYVDKKCFLEYSNNQNGSRGLKTGAECVDKKGFLEYSNGLEYAYNVGDGYKILRNGTEICGGEISAVKKDRENNYVLTLKYDKNIRVGDAFCITTDIKQLERLNGAIKKLPLKLKLTLACGQRAALIAECGETVFEAFGNDAERALNKPLSREIIAEKLGKINEKEEVFYGAEIVIEAEKDVFYPLSSLNDLRRAAVSGLKERLLADRRQALRADTERLRGELSAAFKAAEEYRAESEKREAEEKFLGEKNGFFEGEKGGIESGILEAKEEFFEGENGGIECGNSGTGKAVFECESGGIECKNSGTGKTVFECGKEKKNPEQFTGGFKKQREIAAEIASPEQLTGELNKCRIVVFAPVVFSEKNAENFLRERIKNNISAKIYLKLPLQADENDLRVIEGILKRFGDGRGLDGVYGGNPYAWYLAKKYGLKYFAGLFHNVYNGELVRFLRNFHPSEVMLSAELNSKEIAEAVRAADGKSDAKMIGGAEVVGSNAELNSKEIAEADGKGFTDIEDQNGKCYVFAFGRLPIMNFKHCPKKTFGQNCKDCKNGDENAGGFGSFSIRDEKYEYNIGYTKVYNCYHTLYNPFPINLSRYRIAENVYLNLSDLKKNDIACVINCFLSGERYNPENINFTSGHYGRGVL